MVPAGFDSVVGHERALKVLARALASGRVAHSYLFWGPDGIGKERTAMAMAAVLLCKDPGALQAGRPCGHCASCAKTAHADDPTSHPDMHLLAPGEKKISVEDVRTLQQALSFQAYEKGRRIAIIRDAFRMSREAANALLKTVEEPPPETHLFILAPHRARLLPTLVSRCQAIRFDPLPEAEVEKVLVANGVEAGTARNLAALSGGSPGAALALDSETVGEVEREARAITDGLEEMGVAQRFAISERWSKDKDNLELKLQCMERYMSKRARTSEAARARLARLMRVRDLIERNVNLQLALDALFVLGADERLEEI